MQKIVSCKVFHLHRLIALGIIAFSFIAYSGVASAQVGKKAQPELHPLNRLLKNLFNGGKRTAEAKADGSGQKLNVKPDLIDKKAPQNQKHASLYKKAQEALDKKNPERAMALLQFILDDEKDSVVYVEHGDVSRSDLPNSRIQYPRWLKAKLQATELLGKLPEASLRQYRLKYGVTAKRMLEDAIKQNNNQLLSNVSRSYFHTDAGKEALNLLGNKHLDRGEFSLAYHCFSRLEETTLPQVNEPQWQFKYAFAAYHAGRKSHAENLISKIENPEEVFSPENSDLSLEQRFDKLVGSYSIKEPKLREWWMMYGSPSRTGRVDKGEPLLLPRWFYPVTENSPLMKKIRLSIEEYIDSSVPVIPTIQALAVGNKIAFRSLRGVLVLESETGKRLWETKTADSPEVILEKMLSKPAVHRHVTQRFGNFQDWSHVNDIDNPLADILLDNGTYGSITSDGKQLFIIENQVVMPDVDYRRNRRGGVPKDTAQKLLTNRLISYDLTNGHARWFVGGIPMNKQFNQKLPGCYFFGAPVRSGDDLFVIGERNNEIRLFSLNPETGDEKWSCLIAYSSASIKQDLVRRTWTAQVSVDQGVIVCPTTVGWLVGVNRLTQSVEWIHRYSERKQDYDPRSRDLGQRGFASNQDFGKSWIPSAPIITRNRVVFTPPEENRLCCLDLLTGQEVWKQEMQTGVVDSIYLAGVFDDKVVMVKRRSVRAYALEDGSQKWSSPYKSSDNLPAGIGVAVGDRYYLPMQSGIIKAISLKDGKVKESSFLRDENYPLGNLIMSGGMLLSLSPYGLACFEQKGAINEEIRRREELDPRDLWAKLKKAEVYYLQQDDQEAITALKQIDPEKISGDDLERYESIMKNSLVALIQSDSNMYEKETELLEKMIRSEDDQIMYDRLSSERLVQRGDFEQAFHVIWNLSQRASSKFIRIGRFGKTKTLIRNWSRVKLEKLWGLMPEELQQKLSPDIEKLAEETLTRSTRSKEEFLVLLGFHPISLKVRWNLIREYRNENKFAEAETHLKRMLRSANPADSAKVLNSLANLMLEAKLPEDADYYWSQMRNRYSETSFNDGKTVAQILEEKKSTGEWVSQKPVYWGWEHYDWKVIKSKVNNSSVKILDLISGTSKLPFFHGNQIGLKIDQGVQQLTVIPTRGNDYSWVTPLKGKTNVGQGEFFPSAINNHQVVLIYNDVIHCMSPAEKRVLWTKHLSENEFSSDLNRIPYLSPTPEMKSIQVFKNMNHSSSQSKHNGRLGKVTNDYICIYGRRKIHVLDPITGEEIWSIQGVSAEAEIYGNEDYLLVNSPDVSRSIVLNARDGSQVELEGLKTLVRNNILINEKGWLQLENKKPLSIFGLGKNVTRIFMTDPVSRKKIWTHEIAFNSQYSLIDDETLVVLEPTAEMYELNLISGIKRRIASSLKRSEIRSYSSLYTIADPENYYLFVNRRYMDSRHQSSFPRATIPVNGHVYAISRKTGKVRWEQEVLSQHLVMRHFNHSPLLLFAASQYQVQQNGLTTSPQMKLLAIDKQTGKKAVDYNSVVRINSPSMLLKLGKGLMEFRSYSMRLQIRGTKKYEIPVAPNP